MLDLAIDCFCESIRPRDKIPAYRWASGGKIVIPNSAVSARYDEDSSPWFKEPLDFATNGQMHEGYIIAPTGSGKTTIFDILIPYWIANDPGSILAVQATDPEAADYAEKRLNPILDSCDEIKPLLAALARHKRKRDSIAFPHMDLELVGANISSLQRKSKRYVLGDECWLWKHGLMGEARARMHDRWNRVALWVSQGGYETIGEHETELFEGWKTSDQRVWNFQCPQCGEVQPFRRSYLRWVVQKANDGRIDFKAIEQSTRYHCRKCDTGFDDTPLNRRMLADSGRYIVANPNHKPRVHGWTYNVLTVYRIPWYEFASAWTRADEAWANGDKEPRRIAVQKRLAKFWRSEDEAPAVQLTTSDYAIADWADGKLTPGEVARFATTDTQRDHYWTTIRAWYADGGSRLLWRGKVLTDEGLEELRKQYQVKQNLFFIDAQFDTGRVYNLCAKYGWTALHGSGDDGFIHRPPGKKVVKRFYSPLKTAQSPSGRPVSYVFWSNEKVKDVLVLLRSGRLAEWMLPKDIGDEYLSQINSEVKRDVVNKKTGEIKQLYVKLKANHLWDCEAMQVAAALMMRLLRQEEESVDTGRVNDGANS